MACQVKTETLITSWIKSWNVPLYSIEHTSRKTTLFEDDYNPLNSIINQLLMDIWPDQCYGALKMKTHAGQTARVFMFVAERYHASRALTKEAKSKGNYKMNKISI